MIGVDVLPSALRLSRRPGDTAWSVPLVWSGATPAAPVATITDATGAVLPGVSLNAALAGQTVTLTMTGEPPLGVHRWALKDAGITPIGGDFVASNEVIAGAQTTPVTVQVSAGVTVAVSVAASGPPGPAGNVGPQGPQGPQGNVGPAGPATTDASLLASGTIPPGRYGAGTIDLDRLSVALTASATAGGADVQIFGSSGVWTKPAGAVLVGVLTIGGSPGGGSGRRGAATTVRCGGGGSSSAAAGFVFLPAALVGATEAVTIGAGGAGGPAVTVDNTDGNPGSAAGTTSFGTKAAARRGNPGAGGTALTGLGGTAPAGFPSATGFIGAGGGLASTTGGVGGAASTNWGYAGGAGGAGGGITAADAPSAGGAGAGNGAADLAHGALVSGGAGGPVGVAGNNGVAPPLSGQGGTGGGGGGASITGPGGAGGNGTQPGGGAGGGGASLNGFPSGPGGNGAPGLCIVFTWRA